MHGLIAGAFAAYANHFPLSIWSKHIELKSDSLGDKIIPGLIKDSDKKSIDNIHYSLLLI